MPKSTRKHISKGTYTLTKDTFNLSQTISSVMDTTAGPYLQSHKQLYHKCIPTCNHATHTLYKLCNDLKSIQDFENTDFYHRHYPLLSLFTILLCVVYHPQVQKYCQTLKLNSRVYFNQTNFFHSNAYQLLLVLLNCTAGRCSIETMFNIHVSTSYDKGCHIGTKSASCK